MAGRADPMWRAMRRVLARLALPLPLVAAACAQGPTLGQRLSVFVNQTEGDLVAALGVPERTYEAEGRKFLQYETRRTVAYAEPGLYRPYFGPWGPYWRYAPAPTSYAVVGCDITFALRAGRVESFTYRGQGC